LQFVADFYRALEKSKNIASSLQVARLTYLRSGRENGVYDWAGYQVYVR
jgi:predicted DNA-binding ribbon-helix-helix protein